MGREIRMVIPNWEHPKKQVYDYMTNKLVDTYLPMYDQPYIKAINEWIENHNLWEAGKHPDQKSVDSAKETRYYAEWDGDPPEIEYYRPNWSPDEATWYQVYETVSEGTPVTPPFATQDELIDYLVENGDFWDQKRRSDSRSTHMPRDPWTREQAEGLVKGCGFSLSMVIENGVVSDGIGRKM